MGARTEDIFVGGRAHGAICHAILKHSSKNVYAHSGMQTRCPVYSPISLPPPCTRKALASPSAHEWGHPSLRAKARASTTKRIYWPLECTTQLPELDCAWPAICVGARLREDCLHAAVLCADAQEYAPRRHKSHDCTRELDGTRRKQCSDQQG
eukprot:6191240-Pleurochrysis_carterae.AAC.4